MFRKVLCTGVRLTRRLPTACVTRSFGVNAIPSSCFPAGRRFYATEQGEKPAEESAKPQEGAEGGDAGAKGGEEQQKPPEKDAKTLTEELNAALAECKRLKNELAYALADIDNVRKIAKKDVTAAREYALKDFGKDLLDVADTLDRALTIFPEDAKKEGSPSNSIYVGIEMTSNAMRKTMEKHGITKMEIEVKKTDFDPNFHMAIFQQPVPGLPAGIIFHVVKPGYMIKNRVLRPANVGVSAEPPEEEAPKN